MILCALELAKTAILLLMTRPVADFDDVDMVKKVKLDEVCRRQQVNDGCFPSLDCVPEFALTLDDSGVAAGKIYVLCGSWSDKTRGCNVSIPQ